MSSVKISNRLSTTPCVIVASKFGQTANMERIMKAQVRCWHACAMCNSSATVFAMKLCKFGVTAFTPALV